MSPVNVASALCIMSLPANGEENSKKNQSARDVNDELKIEQRKIASQLLENVKKPVSLFYRKVGTFNISPSSTMDVSRRQFDERRKMIMHHRASHERFRNNVLSSIQGVINNTKQLKESRSMLDETIHEYEDMMVSCM